MKALTVPQEVNDFRPRPDAFPMLVTPRSNIHDQRLGDGLLSSRFFFFRAAQLSTAPSELEDCQASADLLVEMAVKACCVMLEGVAGRGEAVVRLLGKWLVWLGEA